MKYIQHLIICLITLTSLFFQINAHNGKHIISSEFAAGLFYNFLGVVNNINYCKKNNLIPVAYWGQHDLYYQENGWHGKENVWEYYFEPISSESFDPKADKVWSKNESPDGCGLRPITDGHCIEYEKQDMRLTAASIIRDYIKLRPYIQGKINSFYKRNMAGKKTIGIHIRGTDKKMEVKPMNIDDLFNDANKLAENYQDCQFFIATDEERILKRAKQLLKKKVIYYDAYRSKTGAPIHYNDQSCPSKARLGEEVVIETFLLAKCDLFLHGFSSVSTAALFINPELEHKTYMAKGGN